MKPDINKNPLGELLVSLRPSDLEPAQADLPSFSGIGDCQYVTSYNWLTGKDSTILVPGGPLCTAKTDAILTQDRSTSPVDASEGRSKIV